ncbi:MAG: serine hydrolase [Acidobacteriota bacterium]
MRTSLLLVTLGVSLAATAAPHARQQAPVQIASASPAPAGAVYPTAEWERHSQAGWSQPLLKAARDYMAARQTSAVMIVQGGRVVDQWGDTTRKINMRSARKSMLSALYGIHVAEGHIDLGRTMGELGIDDNEPSLTDIEKQATILDLLRARSGVYHPAAYETPGMKAARPKRSSQLPGTAYYYNNWDFNALGTIFEKLTGKKIFEEFEARIAGPIGMQDFRASDGKYETAADSIHAAYPFRMTARDMARFGYLYLRGGRWGERQVVPAEWVRRSTTPYTTDLEPPYPGYGFLWWVNDTGFAAHGLGGHVIHVVPSRDLVIVHRVANDDDTAIQVAYQDIDVMIRLIIAAAPK